LRPHVPSQDRDPPWTYQPELALHYDYQTPNFALGCNDIPKGASDRNYPEMPFRITMQNLEPDDSYCPVPDADALFTAPEESLPPAIILDYVFGAAA